MKNITKLYNELQVLQPLKAEDQKRLDDKFMLEFNFNSNHIEGNTLTYGQTKLLLIFGKVESEEGNSFRDFEEMKAHAAGLRWIKELASDKEHLITEREIKELNHIILAEDYYKTDKNGNRYEVHVGQYKTRPNSVITATGEEFAYASPEETPALMYDLVKWLGEEMTKEDVSPIELAALFHYRYIRIHPFEDGNGRVARLLVTYILERYNYPMVIIKSKDKEQYLTALNRADANVGLTPSDGALATLEQIAPFTEYMKKQLEWSLTVAISAAKGESIDEDEDWKKKLSIELGDKKGAPRRTDELSSEVRSKVYEPLLDRLHDEISQFFPLFSDVKWGYETEKSDVFLYQFIKGINQFCIMRFRFIEEGYKYTIYIDWEYWGLRGVTCNYSKRYDQKLSEDEIKDIINKVGKKISEYYDIKHL